jgi:hypothetical protein
MNEPQPSEWIEEHTAEPRHDPAVALLLEMLETTEAQT